MTSQSTLSNAFWKSTNTEYNGVCHSSDCSMIIRSVAMWSVQDLSWRKPACSSRRVLSRAFLSLSRMILVRILLGTESSRIPPASCYMMTGPLSSAVSPGTLSSIPLGSARSPRSSSGVGGSSLWRSGRLPLVLLVECRLGLLPCLTSRT